MIVAYPATFVASRQTRQISCCNPSSASPLALVPRPKTARRTRLRTCATENDVSRRLNIQTPISTSFTILFLVHEFGCTTHVYLQSLATHCQELIVNALTYVIVPLQSFCSGAKRPEPSVKVHIPKSPDREVLQQLLLSFYLV